MQFKSRQIKGKGRGKLLGFPTINLEIPAKLTIEEGIYAAKVKIAKKEYLGAMHFGPVPTFNENEKSLEVFLIGLKNHLESPTVIPPRAGSIFVKTLKKIREIRDFESPEELSAQIKKDVEEIKKLSQIW